MTYRQLQRLVTGILRDNLVPSPETDALFLLQFVSGTDLTHFLLIADDEVPEEIRQRVMELANRRAQRIPLQHLTGTAPFMGRDFKVSPDVLIPRPDTEVLADEAVRILKKESPRGRVLDLCTGSGILAVTLALEMPEAEVWASDLSKEALKIAGENARAFGADVHFTQGDLFTPLSGRFDMIVTNPPYIATDEIALLEEEVKDHDPFMALDGGPDGFLLIDRIIEEAPRYLKENGCLLMEIGSGQGEGTLRRLDGHGFRKTRIIKDLAGLDRVAAAVRPLADTE